jgi:hypothetical protein
MSRGLKVPGSWPGTLQLTGCVFTGKISALPNRLLGPIAQLGARLNGIEKVVGSNPTGSTGMSQLVLGRLVFFERPAAKTTVDFFSAKREY